MRTTSRVIFRRDTTRENIATPLSVAVLFLIEYVLKEYLGGVRMELPTFIDHFVNARVTVRTSRHRILYQVHADHRNPMRLQQWYSLAEQLTHRKFKQDGRAVIVEVITAPTKAAKPGGRKCVAAPKKSSR